MVKEINLSNRQEWLENRKKGLGGSDIAAVVGLNPYKTNVELWREKVGLITPEDISDKPYVKYGTEAEEYLRELFKLDFPEYQVFYVENNSFVNDKYPWARASLDGWLKDKDGRLGIWECKTTEIMNPCQWDNWKDAIPQNYYCQVLFYMAVMEAEFAVLKAQIKYRKGDEIHLTTRHYFIERSEVEEDIEYLMKKGKNFWHNVETKEQPDYEINI